MSTFPITCLLIEDFGPDYHGAHAINETFMGETLDDVTERIVWEKQFPVMVLEIAPNIPPRDVTAEAIRVAGEKYLKACTEDRFNFTQEVDEFFAKHGFEPPRDPDEFGDAVDNARDAGERAKEGAA